ncbi:MAG: 50S ribosomal protein L11 methyltransferase [Pseudomonadota bacterium]
MTSWREISVRVEKDSVDEIEEILSAYGAEVVNIASAEQTEEIFDLLDKELRLWRYVEISGLFPNDSNPDPLLLALTTADIAQEDISVSSVENQDWVANWQRDLKPTNFGNGLFVCPPDIAPPSEATRIVQLVPGMAFGSGSHPTTAMCLRWIGARDWASVNSAVDFGCGSGILAIAMALCGAKEVYACDIDPDALNVAAENIAQNELDNVFVSSNEALSDAPKKMLVANILLEPLIAEKNKIAQQLAPGGVLAMSGILKDQSERLIEAYSENFSLTVAAVEEEWALVTGNRN